MGTPFHRQTPHMSDITVIHTIRTSLTDPDIALEQVPVTDDTLVYPSPPKEYSRVFTSPVNTDNCMMKPLYCHLMEFFMPHHQPIHLPFSKTRCETCQIQQSSTMYWWMDHPQQHWMNGLHTLISGEKDTSSVSFLTVIQLFKAHMEDKDNSMSLNSIQTTNLP